MSPRIQTLPTDVVHHIAAGEVIDSLTAVVRELVENALDAQATRLTISLWPEAGRVRVADNGIGIPQEDLRCAVLPHSTSKIRTQADLWRIQSLGFRGQALHSLSQVAALEIWSRSRLEVNAPGWRMAYSQQGEPVAEETVAIAPGTIVTVSNLFATWPTRLQSLPSIAQQLRAIQLCIQQIALCYPQVTFQVELRDAPWFTFAPSETAHQRLPQILKNVAVSDLRELHRSIEATPAEFPKNASTQEVPSSFGRLYVLIGLPDRCHRRRSDWIKVAINGRIVALPEIEQTVIQAFRFTLPRDRHPVCFIHLQTNPNHIDWNRHPNKSEVYLQQLDVWNAEISRAISDLLRLHPDSFTQTSYQQRVRRLIKTAESDGQYPSSDPINQSNLADDSSKSPGVDSLRAVAQVQQRYILAEHNSGICLIEQHIAHERVLYERLSQNWALVPLPHPVILENLSSTQVENLQQLQIEIAPFGHQHWAVRSAPAPLAMRSDLLDALLELSLSANLEAALVATACRTALRNGTLLSLETMQELLADWQNTRNPHTCPHGRPVCLTLEETSLARFFKRHWVIGKSHGI